MATLDWPAGRVFQPASMRWGARTPKTAWAAPYTGQVQSISHLADRLTCTLFLPPCRQADAGPREAYLMELHSAGHWVRMWHQQRPTPRGTLRGSPTVLNNAAAGARTLMVTGGTALSGLKTLQGGDYIGVGSQLIPVGYAGAIESLGDLTVPLALPLRKAVTATSAVLWDRPTGTFQVVSVDVQFDYTAPSRQMGLEVVLTEVFA